MRAEIKRIQVYEIFAIFKSGALCKQNADLSWHSGRRLSGLVLAGPVVADDLETCMTEMLLQSSDSTTVGEIRARCAERIQAEIPAELED